MGFWRTKILNVVSDQFIMLLLFSIFHAFNAKSGFFACSEPKDFLPMSYFQKVL
jgi:hypothetical protein